MTPTTTITTTITPALATHAAALTTLTKAAFTKYIPRIGKPPAPMLVDYENLLASNPDTDPNNNVLVYVLLDSTADSAPGKTETETILGSITLVLLDSSLQINNLVVDPAAQGRGYGRRLIEFAEGKARELDRGAVTLATNVKMVENIAVYGRLGYKETGRGVEEGFERVFMRKDLGDALV